MPLTGNVVLMGVAFATGDFEQAGRHAVPIAAFCAGIVVARLLARRLSKHGNITPHLVCLLAEALFLFGVEWLPASFPSLWLTLGVAFVAAIQLSTFATVRGIQYASTFTTGNLRKLAESAVALFHHSGDVDARVSTAAFAAVCLAFLAGATVGGTSTLDLHNRAAWIVAAWLTIVVWRLVGTPRPSTPRRKPSDVSPA